MGDDAKDQVKIADDSSDNEAALATEATEDLSQQLVTQRERSQAEKKREKTGITESFGKPKLEEETSPFRPIKPSDSGGYRVRAPGEPGAPPTVADKPNVILEPVVLVIAYPGETINRDVQPAVLEVSGGQNLKDIAREHQGPGASEEDIKKHVKEIAHVNGIKNPNSPLGPQVLTLPGHTKNGGFITTDAEGNTRTLSSNGDLRVDNNNGTRYVRTVDKDGCYTENHYGPRPEDNYMVMRTADGKYQVAEGAPEGQIAVRPVYDAAENDVRAERAKLRDLAEATIQDPKELTRFRADMVKLDERSKQLQDTYEKQGLSETDARKKAQEEIAKTYKQIGRLLEQNESAPVDQKKRIQIAEQVLHQAADPTAVDQGQQGTCNVATVESRAYTVNPSEAARLVADVAATGKYKSNAGTEVTFDKKDLEAFGESKKNPPEEGGRSYASQIFQVTAINVHYSREHANGGPDIRYRQEEHKPGAKPDPDYGERLYDYKDPNNRVEVLGPDKKEKRTPGLSTDAIVAVSKEIVTGDKDPAEGFKGTVLIQRDSDDSIQAQKEIQTKRSQVLGELLGLHKIGSGGLLNPDDPEAMRKAREGVDNHPDLTADQRRELRHQIDILEQANLYGGSKDGVVHLRDEKQFNEVLAKAKAEGRLPIIVHVYTYHDPFSAANGGSDAGDQGGAHVVTVTDYHPAEPPSKLARVSVDNQWGKQKDYTDDKGILVTDLFKATKASESINELEALKIKRQNKDISDADYDREVEQLMLKAERRWSQEEMSGSYSKSEHDHLVNFWASEVRTLKPPSRIAAIQSKLVEDCKKEGLTDPSQRHS